MCSRYYVELSPELRPIIEAAQRSSLTRRMVHDLARTLVTRGDVRPTDIAPVIASNARGQRAVFPMVWGFCQAEQSHTRRSQPLINARSETADTKPTFRTCWLRRRCVVPAVSYYEWEHLSGPNGTVRVGDPYCIQPAGATVTWLAGLYRMEDGFPHFTILTREPVGALSRLHRRMPLLLPQDLLEAWIDPYTDQDTVQRIARSALTQVVLEKASLGDGT